MREKSNEKNSYYSKIKSDAVYLFEKYNLSRFIKIKDKEIYEIQKVIYIEKLYNLLLNIANQQIFKYEYIFTKDDINFIIDFEIDKIIIDILDIIQKRVDNEKGSDNDKKYITF